METKNYVVAIDLGSSSVKVVVGKPTAEGISVVALAEKPCAGVTAGLVMNMELVAEAIDQAKEEIRRRIGVRLTEAYAGISGSFVRSASHQDYVFTQDQLQGVSQYDVDELFKRMRGVKAPADEQIMELIPQNYLTDTNEEVKNPVGSFSSKLTSTFNFILCSQTATQRLELALKRSGIVLKAIYPNVSVLPEVALTAVDKEEGAVLVDIGAGLSDVAIYHGGRLRYSATLPLGGNAINRDIRSQSIPERYVERLKCRFGSAVMELAADSQIHIEGRTARESKDILQKNLASVIEARLKDVVEFVREKVERSGYANRPLSIVLTGGTAQMQDIEELFHRQTGCDVRLGVAEEGVAPETIARYGSPQYATAIALLKRGAESGPCTTPIDEAWLREQEEAERERQARLELERIEREEQERLRIEAEQQEAAERRRQEEAIRQRKAELERQLEALRNSRGGATPVAPEPTPAPTPAPAPQPAPAPAPAPKPAPAPAPVPMPEPETQPEEPKPQPEPVEPTPAPAPAPTPEPTPEPQPKKRSLLDRLSSAVKNINDRFSTIDDGSDEI